MTEAKAMKTKKRVKVTKSGLSQTRVNERWWFEFVAKAVVPMIVLCREGDEAG